MNWVIWWKYRVTTVTRMGPVETEFFANKSRRYPAGHLAGRAAENSS